MNCKSPSPLIWILSIVFVSLVIAAIEDELAYVKVHGTDRMTSGVWDLIGKFPYGDEKLKQLAQDAHRQAEMGIVHIYLAVKESKRWLDFHDPEKYPFIKIDVLVYAVEGHVENGTNLPYFYYITKGLRPDCVYYLTPEDEEAWEVVRFTLDRHVCGVRMPLPP